MPRDLILEVFLLTVYIARGLPEREVTAIRRTLNDRRFQARLRQSLRTCMGDYPELRRVRVGLSR
jgi:hypothetical protein